MMEIMEERKNRQLQAMLEPAMERLKEYNPKDICENAKVNYEEEEKMFCIPSMGQDIKVRYPDFTIDRQLEMWHHLTLLQYLYTADGAALSGNWKGLQQMRGGISRGRGFDKDIETMFDRYFSKTTKEEFAAACVRLGGEIIDGKADITAVIYYMPQFPVLVTFWEADDEFGASGKTLVDENAEHYLEIEAAGGACSAVVQELRKQVEKV